mmetsp:Transcript_3862/g.6265  ORF Transcript_3862/g.6265 Transcript_3862/m.6265 type:complete len:81 (-) Transcript_3862:1231-1473(-)
MCLAASTVDNDADDGKEASFTTNTTALGLANGVLRVNALRVVVTDAPPVFTTTLPTFLSDDDDDVTPFNNGATPSLLNTL